ncbi:PepSY domain-containing protein [uncultured Methylobacterium sp.]|jgi:uncharacterized membrane protein YkoI|uniref:PepSY domain-containing protein n=1 Tax=uncultured Methylobacterium sp. TaxID=157278 RepID=UPI0026100763|nr:PepSY domain-containing protein [uncultured Methylobacterium sp.]
MLTRLAPAAAILLLGTGLGLAQTTAPTAPTAPSGAPAATRSDGDKAEYEAAKTVKSTLAQAIATAESQGEKGRAIDADFEKQKGDTPTHWAIKVVYPDGKLVEYGINADTGALFKTENQPIERYFTRLKVSDFQNATLSLKDAIAVAEQHAGMGAKAYEAEVEREGNAVEYEIDVALADRSVEVKIGPDGKVKMDK